MGAETGVLTAAGEVYPSYHMSQAPEVGWVPSSDSGETRTSWDIEEGPRLLGLRCSGSI